MWMFVDELDSIGTGRNMQGNGICRIKLFLSFCFCDSRLLRAGRTASSNHVSCRGLFSCRGYRIAFCILHARDYQNLPSYLRFGHYQCLCYVCEHCCHGIWNSIERRNLHVSANCIRKHVRIGGKLHAAETSCTQGLILRSERGKSNEHKHQPHSVLVGVVMFFRDHFSYGDEG